MSRIGSPRAQEYVRNLPFMPKVAFARLFPIANPDALDILDKMLAFDPSRRILVEEALEHSYLQVWHDASDEPACPKPFEFYFEIVEDVAEMKNMILSEVMQFRHQVRGQPQAQIGGPAGEHPGNVPIPDKQDVGWNDQAPRPHEAGNVSKQDLLERELAGEVSAPGEMMRAILVIRRSLGIFGRCWCRKATGLGIFAIDGLNLTFDDPGGIMAHFLVS